MLQEEVKKEEAAKGRSGWRRRGSREPAMVVRATVARGCLRSCWVRSGSTSCDVIEECRQQKASPQHSTSQHKGWAIKRPQLTVHTVVT